MDLLTLIIVLLVIMWLVGMGTAYTLGGLLHVLLVIAVVVLIIRLARGEKVI